VERLIQSTMSLTIFTESRLPEMLHQARCRADIELETVMLKDSNDMTDLDRGGGFCRVVKTAVKTKL